MNMPRTSPLLPVFTALLALCAGCSTPSEKMEAMIKKGQFRKAIKFANKKLRGEAENKKKIYYNRGRAHKELGHTEKALSDYRKAIKLNNGESWARWPCYRIAMLRLQQENYEEAINYLSKALKFKRDWIRALSARADAYEEIGNHADAEADRNRIKKIKKRRRRKRIRKEFARLKKVWNEHTGGAPLKKYETPVKGASPGEYHDPPPSRHVLGDTPAQVASEWEKATMVNEYHPDEKTKIQKWKWTWWYDSHPDTTFDYFLTVKYILEDGKYELTSTVKERGHKHSKYPITIHDNYIGHFKYDENEEKFPDDVHPRFVDN